MTNEDLPLAVIDELRWDPKIDSEWDDLRLVVGCDLKSLEKAPLLALRQHMRGFMKESEPEDVCPPVTEARLERPRCPAGRAARPASFAVGGVREHAV